MRFIDDQVVVIGQSAIVDSGVGDQERVIGDQNVSRLRFLARLVIGANPFHLAGTAERAAVLILRAQSRPNRPLASAQVDSATVAGRAVFEPDENLCQGPQFIQVGRFSPPQRRQPPRTEIIAPALHQRGLQFLADNLTHERNVLLEQLLLQIDSVGRDGYALPVGYRP